MSQIRAKLDEDIKTTMKARDQRLLLVLRGLAAELKQSEIDTRQPLTDEKALAILQKELKKRRDALQFSQDAGREDLIEKNNFEIEQIKRYLGDQLGEAELRAMIGDLIAGGADSIGKIMGGLNQSHKGKFEGAVASAVAKELLAAKGA